MLPFPLFIYHSKLTDKIGLPKLVQVQVDTYCDLSIYSLKKACKTGVVM